MQTRAETAECSRMQMQVGGERRRLVGLPAMRQHTSHDLASPGMRLAMDSADQSGNWLGDYCSHECGQERLRILVGAAPLHDCNILAALARFRQLLAGIDQDERTRMATGQTLDCLQAVGKYHRPEDVRSRCDGETRFAPMPRAREKRKYGPPQGGLRQVVLHMRVRPLLACAGRSCSSSWPPLRTNPRCCRRGQDEATSR